jgi:hypothetical protein
VTSDPCDNREKAAQSGPSWFSDLILWQIKRITWLSEPVLVNRTQRTAWRAFKLFGPMGPGRPAVLACAGAVALSRRHARLPVRAVLVALNPWLWGVAALRGCLRLARCQRAPGTVRLSAGLVVPFVAVTALVQGPWLFFVCNKVLLYWLIPAISALESRAMAGVTFDATLTPGWYATPRVASVSIDLERWGSERAEERPEEAELVISGLTGRRRDVRPLTFQSVEESHRATLRACVPVDCRPLWQQVTLRLRTRDGRVGHRRWHVFGVRVIDRLAGRAGRRSD